jgi:hypothetical protein
MPFIYHDPATVKRPQKFIRTVDVLYDGGVEGFSLAVIDWEGTDHIGMRWNVAIKEHGEQDKHCGAKVCAGSPALNGAPSWFILPRELFNPVLFDKDSAAFLEMVAKWPGR